MIILLRRWLKGGGFQIVLWAILIVIALVFLLPEMPRMAKRTAAWVVTVNGQELRSDTLERKTVAFEEYIQQIKRQWGQYAETIFKLMGAKLDPRRLAFEQMIKEELLNQAAQKLNLHIHPDYLRDKLFDPVFLQSISDLIPLYAIDPSGGINERVLNSHLQRFGLSSRDFNQELQNALERQVLSEMILAATYIPSYAVKEEIIDIYAQKKFSIIALSLDKLYQEEKKKKISLEGLKQFFDKKNITTKQYMIPEKRSGIIWKFGPRNYDIKISKEEIEEYYNAQKVRQFADKPTEVQVRRVLFKVENESELAAVFERAQQLHEQLLRDPEQFAQKTKELSEDSETAKKGGLLPFFSHGTYEKEFEKTAFLLKEDGDISNVIRTAEGVEILQRVAKKSQTFKPLSQVEKQIREKLELRSFKEQFLQDMKELLEEGEVDEQALQTFIEKRGGISEMVGPIAKDKSKLAQKLFKLARGDLSFYIDESIGVAVKLTDIQEKHIPALETIKDDVERDLYRERASKRLSKLLKDARKQLETKSFDEIAKELGVLLQTVDWVTKEDTKKQDELRNKGLPVEVMFQLEKVGNVLPYEDDEHGYLIRLTEIKPLDTNIFTEKEGNETKRELIREQCGLLQTGLVASLFRNAIIKTSESFPFSTEDNAV